jgi:hypothetical protein
MHLSTVVFIFLNLVLSSNAQDLYPSYNLSSDPMKVSEWSDNPTLAYITTARLYDYDHHIFQYRHYPCQYFYTDEIQMHHTNEIVHQCLHNTTTNDYEFSFQLHLDSRHVEPFILRNIAVQCIYINCSFSLLNVTYLHIGWNLKSRENNPDCSFDINKSYAIVNTPYTVSELITLRCKSLLACNRSQINLEQALPANIQLIYGSSYELETPYCSLEKSVSHVMETNIAQTNLLLKELIEISRRGYGKSTDSEQTKKEESIKHISTTLKNTLKVQKVLNSTGKAS